MVNVEVEVISSKEIIKPSSPTPNHLRHYQFSLIDQISPPIYTSLVLFYEFNGEIQPAPAVAEISKHLKKSLSEVLTLFYPLAGRVKIDNHFVDCNDEGIPYLEAQVTNCRLCDFLQNPMPGELFKLIPFELHDHANSEFALGVQLSTFECGGFAIGLCTSHKLADGLSMLMFTKTWAAICRGEKDEAKIERPEFVSATLFPPANDVTGYGTSGSITTNKITKRFVFKAPTIEDLREKYTGLAEDDREKRPSRVETVSAFIWRRFAEATKDDHSIDENMFHGVAYTVNLRPRADPPLPRCSFGNIYQSFFTTPFISSGVDDQESCHEIVKQVREELSKIDKDHVKRLQKGEHGSYINQLFQRLARPGKVVMSSYSSLCRFPIYDTDFGWGRPTWVAVPPPPMKNLIVLADTKEAGGIEAYVSLADDDAMTKFESDAFIQRRVGMMSRVCSAGSNVTGHPACRPAYNQAKKFHTRSQPSVIEKPFPTKPMKLRSGSVLFSLFVKFLKK